MLSETPGDQYVHAARAHTLRVHVDAEPGRLTPLVSPTLWARRITLGTIFEPLVRYVPPDGQGPGRYAPRLAQSWRVMPSGLEIRIELEYVGGRTRMVLTHAGVPADSPGAAGWAMALDKLAARVEAHSD